jgi:DNA primase
VVRRGFDPGKVIETWGVRGIGITAALSWRLWIPIHYKGEVVSWTTRGLGSGRSRYMTAKPSQEKMHHKELLYGEDYCDPHRGVIVHEGPIDVWATGEGSVATMGLTYTKAQVLRLAKYPVRAVCFDAEPAASRRASQLATALADFPGTTHIVHLESGKDPAEITFLEREQLRRKFLR